MPIDPSIPKDNDLISTFPAAIREARQVVAEYAAGDTPLEGITVEHPIGSSTFITAEELACVSGVASNIQDQIDGKDPAGTAAGLVSTHASSSDHDGRYYTETEVNTLLSGKADVTQLHNAVTVTDTTSINLTLAGQALSADAIFGTTSGTVAQGSDSRFVTNGDSHDHAGGDGAAISLTSAVAGILPVANGGTGSDFFSATGVLVGDGNNPITTVETATAGRVLTSQGTNKPAFSALSLSNPASITGALPVANGGTGSSTQNFVDLTTSQSIAGDKTFTGSVTVKTLKVNSSTLQPACSADFGVGIGVTDAAYPVIQIKNTAAPADKKYFRMGVGIGGSFVIGRVNDAYSVETLFLRYDVVDNLSLSPAGLTALVVPYTASATNYHQFNSSAGGAPVYYTQGSASDVSMGLSSKGTGNIFFYTYNATAAQFQVTNTASAVNRLAVTGAATAGLPQLYAAGADTNIGFGLVSKGTYGFAFWTGGGQQFGIGNTASSVNYLSTYGGVAGAGISLTAIGTDTNIQNYINAKGSYPTSFTGAGGAEQFRVTPITSAVNYLNIFGNTTGSAPTVIANGSDANIDISIQPKGTGRVKGTMLSFACERSTLPTVGLTFAFGNGNSAGLGAVMPYAGKLVAVGISGMGVNGTLTADAYIDGVANTSYQISLTGSATNVKNYTQYATPLSFVAGTSINWQVSAVPTAGTGFIITFFVVFN